MCHRRVRDSNFYAASRAAILRDAVAGRATVVVGSVVAGSGVGSVYETADQTGGNVAKRDPTDDGEHRAPETLINSPTEDESGGSRDRNSGKRLILYICTQTTARRRLIR